MKLSDYFRCICWSIFWCIKALPILVLTQLSMLIFSRKEESIILPPIVEDGPEVAVLIVPGAEINGEAYQDLGEYFCGKI